MLEGKWGCDQTKMHANAIDLDTDDLYLSAGLKQYHNNNLKVTITTKSP